MTRAARSGGSFARPLRVLGIGDYNELGSIYLRLIAEGALARLEAGRRCFERYRRELGLHRVGRVA